MKKLLSLALVASLATANDTTLSEIKEDAKDVGSQFAQVVIEPANAIKDITITVANNTIDAAQTTGAAIKETTQSIVNSEGGQDVLDVLGQFKDAPIQAGQEIAAGAKVVAHKTKEVASAIADKTKEVAQKVADSEFVDGAKDVAKQAISPFKEAGLAVKDVAVQVVAATKRGAVKVKNVTVDAANKVADVTVEGAQKVKTAAKDVYNSEAGQEVRDVGSQFKHSYGALEDFGQTMADAARAVKSAIWD